MVCHDSKGIMQIAPAGDRAVLVTMPEATPAELRAFAEEARKVAEAAVVGYESVLVIGEGARRAPLPNLGRGAQRAPSRNHVIPVSFRPEYAPDLTIPRSELCSPMFGDETVCGRADRSPDWSSAS